MGLVFHQSLQEEQSLATKLLNNAIVKNHLANAYLLVGDNQKAKLAIAKQVAAYLNCTSTEKDTKGSCLKNGTETGQCCQNCQWIMDGKHPQAWLELMGNDGIASKIPVEAARKISEEFTKTSSYKRVAVVFDASQEIFHRPSANALLKTIEEPRGNGVFFLFARGLDNVLQTIVSRCQVIPVVMPIDAMEGPMAKLSAGKKLDFMPEDMDEDAAKNLLTLKQLGFFEWSKALAGGGLKKAALHPTSPSQAMEMVAMLNESLGNPGVTSEMVLDAACFAELEIIGNISVDSPILTDYFSQLLRLSEEAKWRIARYVAKKAVFESFVFKWNQLRFSISG